MICLNNYKKDMSSYTVFEETMTGEKYKPGTVFHCSVLIPDTDTELGLYIGHDGLNDADAQALLRLADEGKAPYCACFGVCPGEFPTSGIERNMRLDDYDLFNSEYSDFLVYELIPAISEKHHLRISDSPDLHMTAGGSSGGISAFTIAWSHPEYFRRVYMSSPSFLAMGRGNEIPVLIRKYETKPLRVYEEYSEDEPNDYFGSSFCAAKEAEMALEFAGYDFRCKYFPGEDHCSRNGDESEAYSRLLWLWDGWNNASVRALRNSPRVSLVVPEGSVWEESDIFPSGGGITQTVLRRLGRFDENAGRPPHRKILSRDAAHSAAGVAEWCDRPCDRRKRSAVCADCDRRSVRAFLRAHRRDPRSAGQKPSSNDLFRRQGRRYALCAHGNRRLQTQDVQSGRERGGNGTEARRVL